MRALWIFLLGLTLSTAVNAEYLSREEFLKELDKENSEGEVTEDAKQAFLAYLKNYPMIRLVMEIGLNRGASTELFLESLPNLQYFVSFDIADHACVPHVAEYFSAKYFPKFHFVRGDSRETLPTYLWLNPNRLFDLIFIDGGHLYEVALSDILNCRLFAHPQTIVMIDDYNADSVRRAINFCVNKGIIAIDHVDTDGVGWIAAHYLFPH